MASKYPSMLSRTSSALLFVLLLPHGCTSPGPGHAMPLKYKAVGKSPEVIALYEAWFGHPKHMAVGYFSQDTAEINTQDWGAKVVRGFPVVVGWDLGPEALIRQN